MVSLLLNEKETVKMLGISRSTLRNLRLKNAGPAFVVIGRRRLFRPNDIATFIEEHRVLPYLARTSADTGTCDGDLPQPATQPSATTAAQ